MLEYVDVMRRKNGLTTTLNSAEPLQNMSRTSPGNMIKVVRLSMVSVLFGSSVMSPVPEFLIRTHHPSCSDAHGSNVCVNVPLVMSISLP